MTTREIDERIAAALERLSARIRELNPGITRAAEWTAAANVAAELRAAEPTSEPTAECTCHRSTNAWEYCQVHRKVRPSPTPPPSLVERLHKAMKSGHFNYQAYILFSEAIDALEAAQADTRRLDALERWACGGLPNNATAKLSIVIHPDNTLRRIIDDADATMEREP